jgi:hypothetical protein
MSALSRRIDRLEQRSGVGVGFTAIIIRGGLPGNRENDFAGSDELSWARQDNEIPAHFRRRAESEARAAGKPFLFFGGLPND